MATVGNTYSPNQKALKRFLKNKPAIFGLVVIVITVIVAVFAHLLAPDNTPNANDQIPEVALTDPGFTVTMLRIRKNQPLKSTGFFTHLLQGTPSPDRQVPINSFRIEKEELIAELYRGMDRKGKLYQGAEARFDLLDIIFPVSPQSESVQDLGEKIQFLDITGAQQTIDKITLRAQVESDHIKEKTFLLGTDKYGRDMLSRLIVGVRVSLIVGLIAVLISLTLGILLGAVAGYFGGKVDDLIMLIINTVWSIPTLLLVFAIVLALGRGVGIIFLAVGLTMWVDVARIVRGQVLAFREIQFVEAAQSLGFGNWRIISKHILPNILGPVMVIAAANFATAILIEAGLSYLGFGIQPPTPSWGNMLNENYGMAIGGKPLLALIPALAIMLLVLAFNLIGNGLRDALDVKAK